MLTEFSDAYYHASMYVEPYDDGPAIDQQLYDYLSRELYVDCEAPVMVRLGLDGGRRFSVEPQSGIPPEVLGVPEGMVSDDDVFVLKGTHADSVGDYYG
jgi:hypothetical protein